MTEEMLDSASARALLLNQREEKRKELRRKVKGRANFVPPRYIAPYATRADEERALRRGRRWAESKARRPGDKPPHHIKFNFNYVMAQRGEAA